jgi:carbamoyltransferase
MAKILGISAFYHDSAAALTVDGQIVAAASEERFSRLKNDAQFPSQAAAFCLSFGKISPRDLDAVVYYEKPFLTFERILETTLSVAPRGYAFFAQAFPVWIRDKLFLKTKLHQHLRKTFADDFRSRLFFSEHHVSHAAAAYYPSPFDEAAILTVDGVGEWKTLTIGHGHGQQIQNLRSMKFPDSWGLFYSAVTAFLGFKVNSGEYKMMGLAPYGNAESSQFQTLRKKITEDLIQLGNDGSLALNPYYFAFTTSNEMFHPARWQKLLGLEQRKPESELTQIQADFALATQKTLEEGILRLGQTASTLTKSSNLALSGGVALNCVANSVLKEQRIFNNIWVQPAAGDAGSAIGAALAYEHMSCGGQRSRAGGPLGDRMSGALLGPEFSDAEIAAELKSAGHPFQYFQNFDELCRSASALLVQQKVLGWFQDRMEFGPRALGNRSILACAQNHEMQTHLNQKIKFRETFRPFAPIVLSEDVQEYFDWTDPSPYMLFTANIQKNRQIAKPDGFAHLPLREKLMAPRSDLPSITHIDYSARLQTIHASIHPKIHQLLRIYKSQTGCSVLINTSFNVRGEPIVCSPKDAIHCFLKTGMDALVLGNFLLRK